jgi:hypothetical protein
MEDSLPLCIAGKGKPLLLDSVMFSKGRVSYWKSSFAVYVLTSRVVGPKCGYDPGAARSNKDLEISRGKAAEMKVAQNLLTVRSKVS